MGYILGRKRVYQRRFRPHSSAASPTREPLPQPLRADTQRPTDKKPQALEKELGERRQARRGHDVQLLAYHVELAGGLVTVCRGVQAKRRHQMRVDHEANRKESGQRHFPLQQAGSDPAVEERLSLQGRKPDNRELGRAALHHGPTADGRQEIRHAHLRDGHGLQSADSLVLAHWIRQVHALSVEHQHRRHQQHLHTSHQCGCAEDG